MLMNKRSWIAALSLTLAGCGVGDSQQEPTEKESQSAPRQLVSPLAIPVERVPLEFHRRAAQLLEDVRGTESAPTWGTAVLASSAQPLYRPDVTGVAYYEFRVLVRGLPSGFIIVSTGGHDFPVSHWAFEGQSPTETLFQQGGTAITAFYKVDALTYVAEGSRGEMLAKIGELPPRITGQDPSWLDRPIEPTDATWVTDAQGVDDVEASRVTFREDVRGPKYPSERIELTGWSSWQELKANYRESYATLAASLARQAGEEWETERVALESGEGLVVGRTLEVALVYPRATVSLGGEGARMVRSELVTTSAGTQKLVLTAFDARPGVELPLTVDVRYPNGFTETVRIIVLAREDVQTSPGAQPAEKQAAGVAWADMGAMNWSPYTYHWAGSHGDQRLYGQIPSGTWPNNSSCASGCGGTAWSMLFGWGDFQAGSGNPTWTKRWGLYRPNGGKTGDAVAPASMDSGVRNMSWELRNHIDTFCWFGSGATAPWNMGDASEYLKGRTGATLSTHYNTFGVHETRLREKARDSIRDRKVPAIIGTGWLTHYPLAYGYRWRSRTVKTCVLFVCWTDTEYQRNFYVNQGWSGNNNGWIGSGTWFAGQLYAN